MTNYNSLDFDKVKNIIASFTPIKEAKENILHEKIDFNPLIIKRKLDETKELLDFLNKGNTISFDGIYSPVELLEKAKKNIILSSNEILDFYTFHNHARRIKNFINNDSNLGLIKEYSDSLNIDANISKTIESIIDPNGNVKNDATNELKNISSEIDANFNSINTFCINFIKNNGDYLQENNVSERNNRYVFLFKNSYKNKFEGYDYGSSGSGQASYVEPSSLVSLNNKRNELEEKKNKEIKKILQSLTNAINNLADDYINNFDILVNISSVYSKAYFGYANLGCVGELSDRLYLQNVRHPLIDQDKVVANTYSLDNDKLGIVISGSNTGGKTVSLKVIGLSICMTYLGIPVIAEKVSIPLFDKVLIDVDSNQSLKDSLSTFSAHLSSINQILNEATSNSIVLIDELISGTDPKEAEAISLSLINKLLDIKSKIIVTTHYGLVKKLAHDRNDLLLSSVEFDEESLMPTYHYIENSFGKSNAFDIANRYLDDKDVILNARNILETNRTNEEKAFNELTNKMNEIEIIKKDLENKNNELANKIKQFDDSVEQRKNSIIEKFNNELDLIKEDIINKINSTSNNKELLNISKNIEHIELLKVEQNKVNYKVGDRVRVNDIGNPGYIVSIKGDNINVEINGLIVNTNAESLTLLPHLKSKPSVSEKQFHHSPSELVIVGEKVEDALPMIESFLDKARLANLKKIKIVHGVGTLTLKNAVWSFLLKINYVDKFYSADYYDGGLATTIVELK